MARRLWGFTIRNQQEEAQLLRSPVQQEYDNSAIEIGTPFGAMQRPTATDAGNQYKSENALIAKYRDAAITPIVDQAIEEICCEAVVNDDMATQPVKVKWKEDSMVPPKIQKTIEDEFQGILKLLDFRAKGHDIFRRWYIDARVTFHKVIDEKNPLNGIQQLRYIDPRKIKLVREFYTDKNAPADQWAILNTKYTEYWIFSDEGIDSINQSYLNVLPTVGNHISLAKDSVVQVTSGLFDPSEKMVVSHLHKILRTLNQLRMLEDAVVIYRLTRAAEKRKFKISVGNLQGAKAEQRMTEMMRRFKNKLSYNSSTGEINEDKRFMALTEDYWFAVRDGEQSTDVEQFPGGSQTGEIDDVELFRQELYKSLNVPVGRLDPQMSPTVDFSGAGTAISRDELKFARFVNRLRDRFSMLFHDLLMTQLVLKGLVNQSEYNEIKDEFIFDFARDSYYSELKELEILNSKVMAINQIQPLVGRVFSMDWVYKNILKWDEKTIEEEKEKIEEESIQMAEMQAQVNGIIEPQDEQDGPAPVSMQVPQMESVKMNPAIESALTVLTESITRRGKS